MRASRLVRAQMAPDQPGDVARRQRAHRIYLQLEAERAVKYPVVTRENVAEVAAWQEARYKELEAA